MPRLVHPSRASLASGSMALLVLVIGLGVSVQLYLARAQDARRQQALALEDIAQETTETLERRFLSYELMIQAAKGLLVTDEEVTRAEWVEFSQAMSIGEHDDGTYGLALVRVVRGADLRAFEERVRAEGVPDFAVHGPDGAAIDRSIGTHYIIENNVPEAANRSTWGLDIASIPVNRKAYQAACDTGRAWLTPAFRLAQQGEGELGVVLVLPVYRGNPTPLTVEERRQQIDCFVALPIGLGQFMGALAERYRGVCHLRFEGVVGEGAWSTLYERPGHAPRPRELSAVAHPILPGQRWSVVAVERPEPSAGGLASADPGLLAGVLISSLLATLVWFGTLTRRRAEALAERMTHSLRESEARYRALVDGAPVCIKELDREGRIVSINPAGVAMAEKRVESELLGLVLADAVIPEDRDLVRENLERVLGGETRAFQYRFTPESGGTVTLETLVVPRRREGDEVCCMICVSSDVTERVQTERRIRESESRYRALVDGAPVCIKELDPRGHILSMNPSGLCILGLERESDIVGQCMDDLVVPEDVGLVRSEHDRVLAGETRAFQFRLRLGSGKIAVMETLVVPRRSEGGRVHCMMCVTQDVTERVRAENRIRENEARLENLTRLAPVGIYRADATGLVVDVSERLTKLTGLTRELACQDDWSPFIHPDDYAEVVERWDRMVAEHVEFDSEYRLRRADGTWAWFHVQAVPERDGEGNVTGFVGSMADNTERWAAEERVRQNEARLANLTRLAPVGIFRADSKGTLVDVSERMIELTGMTHEQMCTGDWRPFMHPDDYQPVIDGWIRLITHQTAYDVEYRLRRDDGTWAWFHVQAVPERDAGGNITGFVGSMADFTERRAVEDRLRRSESRMRELAEQAQAANRIKSEFLANMSHEIRTPMTAILGFAELLEGSVGTDPDALDAIETIRRNGEHLLQIINDVLDISKIETGHLSVTRQSLDLSEMVGQIFGLLKNKAAAKGLELRREAAPDAPRVVATDPVRLRQILLNLVGNAIKFTESGSITVRTSGGPTPGSVTVEVIDTGIGIEPARAEQVFDPFVQGDSTSTRARGGTGLGLSISRKLAEALSGSLLVDPTHRGGSRFVLTLDHAEPAAGDPPIPSPPATRRATTKRAPVASLRVLLAEDCPDSQRLIVHHLREFGHEVVTANNGERAVEMTLEADRDGKPFDLVLMDMQMPKLDGYGAAARLRTRGYAGRIVALTAHAMEFDKHLCLDAGCDEYATKPIPRERLLELVSRPRRAA